MGGGTFKTSWGTGDEKRQFGGGQDQHIVGNKRKKKKKKYCVGGGRNLKAGKKERVWGGGFGGVCWNEMAGTGLPKGDISRKKGNLGEKKKSEVRTLKPSEGRNGEPAQRKEKSIWSSAERTGTTDTRERNHRWETNRKSH